MAIGYDEQNNSIYIIGGGSDAQSMVRYDLNPSNNQILSVYDYGSTYLNLRMHDNSQWYAQNSNILYVLPGNDQSGTIHRLFFTGSSSPITDYNYTNIEETLSTWMNLNHMAVFVFSANLPYNPLIFGNGRNGSYGLN